MPQIDDKVQLSIAVSNIELTTQNGHDDLRFHNLSLTPEQAASLAWLINHTDGVRLSAEIKLA